MSSQPLCRQAALTLFTTIKSGINALKNDQAEHGGLFLGQTRSGLVEPDLCINRWNEISEYDEILSDSKCEEHNVAYPVLIPVLKLVIETLRLHMVAAVTTTGEQGPKARFQAMMEQKKLIVQSSHKWKELVTAIDNCFFDHNKAMIPGTVSSTKEDYMDRGQREMRRYIQEHPNLALNSWITIHDDNLDTLQVHATYQDAVISSKGHKIWFCDQYKGPKNECIGANVPLETNDEPGTNGTSSSTNVSSSSNQSIISEFDYNGTAKDDITTVDVKTLQAFYRILNGSSPSTARWQDLARTLGYSATEIIHIEREWPTNPARHLIELWASDQTRIRGNITIDFLISKLIHNDKAAANCLISYVNEQDLTHTKLKREQEEAKRKALFQPKQKDDEKHINTLNPTSRIVLCANLNRNCSFGRDWRQLAHVLLGSDKDILLLLGTTKNPADNLLRQWEVNERANATIGVLKRALTNMQRLDLIQHLKTDYIQ